jgi:hypothetical protein
MANEIVGFSEFECFKKKSILSEITIQCIIAMHITCALCYVLWNMLGVGHCA